MRKRKFMLWYIFLPLFAAFGQWGCQASSGWRESVGTGMWFAFIIVALISFGFTVDYIDNGGR